MSKEETVITIPVPVDAAKALTKEANRRQLSKARYCRNILLAQLAIDEKQQTIRLPTK
jgi:hypothetical protein